MMYSWVEDVIATWFHNQLLNTEIKLVKATDRVQVCGISTSREPGVHPCVIHGAAEALASRGTERCKYSEPELITN